MAASRSTAGAVLFVAVFAVYSLAVKRLVLGIPDDAGKLEVDRPAPALTLLDTHGKRIDLQEVASRNKVVMVTFWATWCGPCRVELPHLEKLYQERKGKGFEILAVNGDEDRAAMVTYLRERPLTFPVLVDAKNRAARRFGVESLPTSVLIDRRGRVRHVLHGLDPHIEFTLDEYLRRKKGGDG